MKNVIFTICAKNYLAQAYTLGQSIKDNEPDTDFFIIVSDFVDNIELDNSFTHLSPNILSDIDIADLSFKYNVIEFSTAIKPYFISYFFNKNYDKVVYLDPDMYIYNNLNVIYNNLDKYDFIITPHIRKDYIEFNGSTSEEEILFVGIYNLGFFAIRNTSIGVKFIKWWEEKLKNQCYADKFDALHVDQKWLDFLPSFFPENVLIEKSPTINMASWSIHEIDFKEVNGNYYIDEEPLLIYHFSGIDILDVDCINKKQSKFNLNNKPEYKNLFKNYRNTVINANFEYYNKLNYSYDYFENGVFIDAYLRRIYRSLNTDIKKRITSHFGIEENSLYNLFSTNKLLIGAKSNKYNRLKSTIKNSDKKIKLFERILHLIKKIIGIKYYYILVRFMSVYARFENQKFLVKK
jgi:hypothetical protein